MVCDVSLQPTCQARTAAIGTWKYRVEGPAALSRGEFRIAVEEDQLRALMRDERRGRLTAQVVLDGARMELSLNELRISGRIEDDTFQPPVSGCLGRTNLVPEPSLFPFPFYPLCCPADREWIRHRFRHSSGLSLHSSGDRERVRINH